MDGLYRANQMVGDYRREEIRDVMDDEQNGMNESAYVDQSIISARSSDPHNCYLPDVWLMMSALSNQTASLLIRCTFCTLLHSDILPR